VEKYLNLLALHFQKQDLCRFIFYSLPVREGMKMVTNGQARIHGSDRSEMIKENGDYRRKNFVVVAELI